MKYKALKAATFTALVLLAGAVFVVVAAQIILWWTDLTSTNPEIAGLIGITVIVLVVGSVIFYWAWDELSQREKKR
jgi:protein-S-isoprenylcysteine O-methyltransferase Ste14